MSNDTIRLFCSDIDNTLLGNPESARRFVTAWKSLPADRRPLLVYNSGRLVADIQHLVAGGQLLAPDYYIGGVGTQIFDARARKTSAAFRAYISEGWNRTRADEITADTPGIRLQPAEFQEEFKSSWYLDNATPEVLRDLEQRLAAAGLDAAVVYSSARDLDVPGDLSVIGRYSDEFARTFSLPYSSIESAPDRLGRMAVRQLVRRIEKQVPEGDPYVVRFVNPELVDRGSTAAPSASRQ